MHWVYITTADKYKSTAAAIYFGFPTFLKDL